MATKTEFSTPPLQFFRAAASHKEAASLCPGQEALSQLGIAFHQLGRGAAKRGCAFVKLTLFHVRNDALTQQAIVEQLSNAAPTLREVAITVVPVRSLPDPRQLLAIEAVAMDATLERQSYRHGLGPPTDPPYCDVLRCQDFTFVSGQLALGSNGQTLEPGDLVAQNAIVIARLDQGLKAVGLASTDIVKVHTWRAPPPSAAAYREAAAARFTYLNAARPAVTGITVPDLLPANALIQIDAWAMSTATAGQRVRRLLQPPNHWDWSAPTPYSHGVCVDDWIFVGGQAALDEHGAVVAAGDMRGQWARTLHYIENILAEAQGSAADVLCATAYHVIPAEAACIWWYRETTTSVGVDELAYPGQVFELDAIAWRKA